MRPGKPDYSYFTYQPDLADESNFTNEPDLADEPDFADFTGNRYQCAALWRHTDTDDQERRCLLGLVQYGFRRYYS